jgi:SAM-dependent methyltransferase
MYKYKGRLYPDYLKEGDAAQYIYPIARRWCVGQGLDIGGTVPRLPGAEIINIDTGYNADNLPPGRYDYIFSSHCLEHVINPVAVLLRWRAALKHKGILFLYLPHPKMQHWLPANNRKHLHIWRPCEMVRMLIDCKYRDVFNSERDLFYSFAVVAHV